MRAALFLLFSCLAWTASISFGLDLNTNGISDVWAFKYNAATLAPNADADGDGMKNCTESVAGTDPYDNNSGLRLMPTTGDSTLWQFQSQAGKYYQVETSSDLLMWATMGPVLSGNGNITSISLSPPVVSSGDASSRNFYRLRVMDRDSDSDGLTDYEESVLATSPTNTMTHPGINDADYAAKVFVYGNSAPVVIADFEGDSWGGWTVVGPAFGSKPFIGNKAGQTVLGRIGYGMVNSWPANGDGATGKMTSTAFEITQTYLSFLIGGGKETSTVALGVRLEVDGAVVRRATGKNSDSMEWVNWDVAELMGKTGRLIIEDAATGGWGHVVADQFVLSPVVMPIFSVASVFGDHMVLQRDKPVVVWGRGFAGDTIRVTFAGQTKTARTDSSRRWRVELDPLSVSALGRDLTVEQVGGDKAIFSDVLVGEVWLASGQSNMDFYVPGVLQAQTELASANFPTMRMMTVPGKASVEQLDTIGSSWIPATPTYAAGFSAVAYFFARSLVQNLGVPVGIIKASYGGTSAEAWTSPEALSRVPQLKQAMDADLATLAAIAADPVKAADPNRLTLPFARSGGLFNAMINPLVPYTMRGVIWYQGESNAFRADFYSTLLPLMIGDWRARFGQGDFPFYLVQLANYYNPAPQPIVTTKRTTEDWVARLREAQLQVAQTVPQTGMIVAIDLGEQTIHPSNKQDVGDRLARLALAKTYGSTNIAYQSPVYASMTREGAAIRVNFTDCPGGLMIASKTGLQPAMETPGATLAKFAIAGADNVFVWADAKIEGDSVVVSSPAVPQPVAVRYAWELNPDGRNLYGRNGLPASPFRTDSLPLPPN